MPEAEEGFTFNPHAALDNEEPSKELAAGIIWQIEPEQGLHEAVAEVIEELEKAIRFESGHYPEAEVDRFYHELRNRINERIQH